MESLAERLKFLMERENVSGYKLSSDTGVSSSTISRILQKNAVPRADNLSQLASYFDVTDSWLSTGREITGLSINHVLIDNFCQEIMSQLLRSQDLDKDFISINGHSQRSITKRDLIAEINNRTDIGIEFMNSLLSLSVDLLLRGKEKIDNFDVKT